MKQFYTFATLSFIEQTQVDFLTESLESGQDIDYPLGKRCRLVSKNGFLVLKYKLLGILPYATLLKPMPGQTYRDNVSTLIANARYLNEGGVFGLMKNAI